MRRLCICDSRRRHYLREMQYWSFVQQAPTWQVRLLCLSLCLFGSHQVYTRGSSGKMCGAPRLCVQVLCVVQRCVSFGLRCLSGFESSSHALLPMSVWEGKENFFASRKKEKKLSMWCKPLRAHQRRNKTSNLFKGGYYGSSSVKYIFGTMHVMGITTLVTVLACKGLLISPLADFYFLVARVY